MRKAYIALCLLPHLLERKTKACPNPESYFYKFGEANEVTKATGTGMAPFLLISGTSDEPQPDDVSIIGENRVILGGMGLVDALEAMMFLFYVCNLQYPKECTNTFILIQRMVMKVFDTQKVPTKVLVLMSDLSKM